ncbi:MAG TPA: efflux RND transporter permease subunit [Rubrobacteraceae bacterium]|nr:efflux RND transporter permease subunit [Rubrobacteraceae bacterium]
METIVRWCLKNKSVVILAALLLIGAGAYATTRLNQELLPDISFPVIVVSTPVSGAGPDVVDEQVTQPVESAIKGITGIESVQSTSSQGFSVVVVQFNLDTDTEEAEADLQSALDGIQLPSQAGTPEVKSQSASQFPILNLSLAAKDRDLADLTKYAEDDVVPAIEEVDGVASVDLIGGAEKRIQVDLDPKKLKEKGLSTEAVVGAISGAEVDSPVGSVPVGGLDTPIRATSKLGGVKALEDLPVGVEGGSASAAPTGTASSASTNVPAGIPAGIPAGATGAAPSGSASPSGAPAAGTTAAPTATAAGDQAPKPVLLGDVAEVREVGSDLSGISRTNGEPSLGLNVIKETDANTVEVAADVEKVLDDARDKIGDGQVVVVSNSATDVEESVNGLVEEGLVGAALAILVIFAFLRSLRATLVTAVSLPTSVLAALLFSWADNLTLNIITLAGLTIAVGRVVDDAIVVLENSYRYVQRGYEPEEAALKGTTEVASAITSSTLTTTAVFLPLALVGGIISKFFVPLSLTVALALLASLIVAVTIIPVLVSIFVKRRAGDYTPDASADESDDEPLRRVDMRSRRGGLARFLVGVVVFLIASAAAVVIASLAGVLGRLPGLPQSYAEAVDGFVSGVGFGSPVFLAVVGVAGALLLAGLVLLVVRAARRPSGGESDGVLVRLYTPMLRWSLRHRLAVLVLAFLAFAGGLGLVQLLPVSFFPPSEERLLIADVELPAGTSLQKTSDRLRPFEDFLGKDRGVKSYQASIGGEDTLDPESPVRPGNKAQAFINVKASANVGRTLDRIDAEGDDLYGENFKIQVISNGPPQGGLEAILTGGSKKDRADAADMVSKEFNKLDNVNNVESDLSGGNPEVQVTVDPEKAAKVGLSPGGVSSSLGALLGGSTVTTLGDTPVVVGAPAKTVDSLDEVRKLSVGSGSTVGDVAQVDQVESPAAVSRTDGDRAVTVTGEINSNDTQTISTKAQAAVAKLDLPGNVKAQVGGETDDIDESFRNLFLSIIVALVLVFLILVVFFGSLLIPMVILLAVPLTTVGAFGALYLTNTALSVPSLLGILLLIGIVVSNAILLVDFAVKALDHYETPDEAILAAGQARLRPILMTAFATVFALMPLALGLSGGGNGLISSSLAITVVGGLATSTFLTLLVVPVGFSFLKSGLRRKKKV